MEKISEHHFACKVRNCEFFVCMTIRPWWSLSFFKLTVIVWQGFGRRFGGWTLRLEVKGRDKNSMSQSEEDWCPQRSFVLFVLHRFTILTLDHCSSKCYPISFKLLLLLTVARHSPFPLIFSWMVWNNCACPSCVLMCSVWMPSWADCWKTWMLWPDLGETWPMAWYWCFFASFLGLRSLTSEKLGCQIYHLAMAAWEQGSARPWERFFFGLLPLFVVLLFVAFLWSLLQKSWKELTFPQKRKQREICENESTSK